MTESQSTKPRHAASFALVICDTIPFEQEVVFSERLQ
jgi:hypothetical protein